MKVGGWECLGRIAEDLDVAIRSNEHDVVIDEEIRIVVVLVLPGDQQRATVGERSAALAEAIEAPAGAGTRSRGSTEQLAGLPGTAARSNQPLPDGIRHGLRI